MRYRDAVKCHFNPLNNSFWPLEEKISSRFDIFWAIKGTKKHSCDRFRSISIGFRMSIWTLLAVHEGQIYPSLSISRSNLTCGRPNFNSMWPRHLKETTLSRLRPYNVRKMFLRIWPPTTGKWLSVGQIWPCLGQFWAKPNNPNFVYHH